MHTNDKTSNLPSNENVQIDVAQENDLVDSPKIQCDMESVRNEILSEVFQKGETISMAKIHEIFNDGHLGDRRYRAKLKQKLTNEFGDKITFMPHHSSSETKSKATKSKHIGSS